MYKQFIKMVLIVIPVLSLLTGCNLSEEKKELSLYERQYGKQEPEPFRPEYTYVLSDDLRLINEETENGSILAYYADYVDGELIVPSELVNWGSSATKTDVVNDKDYSYDLSFKVSVLKDKKDGNIFKMVVPFYTEYKMKTMKANSDESYTIDVYNIIKTNYPGYRFAQYAVNCTENNYGYPFAQNMATIVFPKIVNVDGQAMLQFPLINTEEDYQISLREDRDYLKDEKVIEEEQKSKTIVMDNPYRVEKVYMLYISIDGESMFLDEPAVYNLQANMKRPDPLKNDIRSIYTTTNILDVNAGKGERGTSFINTPIPVCDERFESKYGYNCKRIKIAKVIDPDHIKFRYGRNNDCKTIFIKKSDIDTEIKKLFKIDEVKYEGITLYKEFSIDGEKHVLNNLDDYYKYVRPEYLPK